MKNLLIGLSLLLTAQLAAGQGAKPQKRGYAVNDSHFHLTNYIQEGTDIRAFLAIMGDKVGRVALFGIPLQQTWSHRNTGDFAPTYYLQSDSPLYYYSFTDAFIAMNYLSLPKRARSDRKSTRLNSSHSQISYAVFCLKKKTIN